MYFSLMQIKKQYFIDPITFKPPFISYDENIVYPVIKDEAAKGGSLNITTSKKLTVDFNCLGIEAKTMLILNIDIPFSAPIQIYLEKECSKETLIDKIEESIVSEEENYGILKFMAMFILLCAILFTLVTCYNMSQGKNLTSSVPFGGMVFGRLSEMFKSNQPEAQPVSTKDNEPSGKAMNLSEIKKPTDFKMEVEITEDDLSSGHKYGSLG